jgi:hypothetical protein
MSEDNAMTIEPSEQNKIRLLKAVYRLMKQCKNSHYVQDILMLIDEKEDCDGYCIFEEIKEELGIE